MIPKFLALAGALLLAAVSGGVAASDTATLDKTDAFDKSYAASFYTFDGCGDGKHGRIFRQALSERFQKCPFTADARQAFKRRGVAQREKSAKLMEALIEEHGGLPMRLEGMTITCHQQQSLPDYVALRDKLDKYSLGQAAADDVLKAPCDADSMAP